MNTTVVGKNGTTHEVRKEGNREAFWKAVFTLAVVGTVVLLRSTGAEAFALGIPALDGFLQSIEDGVPRCGLLMALIGGAAVTLAKFENHFNSFFSGYFNYFVTAGVFGSLVTLLSSIGIVG